MDSIGLYRRKKIVLNKTVIFCLITLLAVTFSGCKTARTVVPGNTDRSEHLFTKEELQKDFGKFRYLLEHKTEGLYTDRARLTQMLDDAETQIDSPMTEIGFYRILAPIIAELRCGHSFLSVSSETETYMKEDALFFPLTVRIIGGKLFVVEDTYKCGVIPGTEILKINGMPVTEILAILTHNLTTDGRDTGRPRYEAERWFAALYYSWIETATSFDLVITEPGAPKIEEIHINGIRDPALAKTAMGIVYDTLQASPESSINNDFAMLKIPVFHSASTKTYNAFLHDFFTSLPDAKDYVLVLDLRGNYGGSPAPTIELFKYLIHIPIPFFAKSNPVYLGRWKKPVQNNASAFSGKLYVLMDEAGFSMNSFLLSLLKYHHIGTIVGAQSAGSYKCSDAARHTTLPNTGLRLVYSTETFSTAVEGQEAGIGIEPDIRIDWTLDDYLQGREPVLEAALNDAGLTQ